MLATNPLLILSLSQPTVLILLDVAEVLATVGLAFYAGKIFLHMRLGRMEKGWRYVTEGVAVLCIGFVLLTLQHTLPRESILYFYFDSLSTILSIVGILLMLLGLRSHYSVWSLKTFTLSNSKATNKIVPAAGGNGEIKESDSSSSNSSSRIKNK